jgi:ABC-type transport system involved in multi-copper enzyme maturation permease subunit
LTAFYCLLALLPITALPFLAGGVTGQDFWRTAVALINALFFSLALGLCVSAFARDSHRALGNALGLLLLLIGALPVLASLASQTGITSAWQPITWVSPLYAFIYATDMMSGSQAHQFWRALGISAMGGCFLLACASVALPHCWQERRKGAIGRLSFLYRSKGSAARRKRLREKLLPQHPVAWLATAELGNQWGAWLVVLAWAAITVCVIIVSPDQAGTIMLDGAVMTGLAFCLKVLFTLQACRFFAEGRRNGALELLLCTPLTNRDILGGQVRALWRSFFWPVLAFILISLMPVVVYLGQAIKRRDFSPLGDALGGLFFTGINSVRLIVGLTAACWFGMGLALTLKRPNLAPVLTIISVLILPSVLCWLDVVPCLILLAVGLSKCQRDLRHLIMEQYTPAR